MEFLHEKNVAGQTLLRLVARGNAIISEILRLSDHIPEPFKLDNRETIKKYSEIIIDFAYLEGREKGKGPDHYERIIETNPTLLALNTELKETYIKKLRRFYNLFEVIFKYGTEFVTYINDIQNGNYIQQTLEGILLDTEGKQIMSEALYLFGVMLLLLDQKIDGVIRERLLISYLRYTGQNELENLDEVANLIERTGYSCLNPPKKRIPGYPEKYLARLKLPKNAVSMIIGRLRSDDIYNQIPAYPLPEHRSTALATQAQMLYVCLFFSPDTLHREEAVMREIVDKHFPDNWVIAMYLGFAVDLTIEWEPYNAARLALANTTQQKLIENLVRKHTKRIPKILQQLDIYLLEGTLNEEYILRNRTKLLDWLRSANVTLRWLMLHTRRSNPKIMELFMKGISQSDILLLLMKTSQFEFTLKNSIKSILDAKKEKWEEGRIESVSRVKELSEVFSGTKALTRVEKNERLQGWFTKIASQIESLDFEDKTVAGRRIQQLMRALEEVALYHQIETNIPVKNFLAETRTFLGKMIRILNISEDVMATINLVSEIAYGREIVYEYIPEMQDRIKKDPGSVLLLRSTFLKLASILQTTLDRIGQVSIGKEAMGKEFVAVSEYYSSELIDFVRRVLLIVPEMMFIKLANIISIQTNEIKEIPMKVEKQEIEKYAQLPQRKQLALLTYEVSQFTEGILALETTLVATIEVDPKQLLEEGIRKILVRELARHLDGILRFTEKDSIVEFCQRLEHLRRVLNGFRNSFNYLQDYMNVYGLKIWQEEFQRIINFNVEQECNLFMKKVHEGAKSAYQSKIIPIPVYPPVKGDVCANFIGRIGKQLILHTDVRNTIYLHKMSAWYSREEREQVGIRTFDILIDSIGVFGVTGLNRLYGFGLVKELQVIVIRIRKLQGDKKFAAMLQGFVKATEKKISIPENAIKMYDICNQIPVLDSLVLPVAEIGQKQLLRRQLANILAFKCKLDSNSLFCSLDSMNKALINDIQAHYRNPEKPYPGGEDSILSETAKYMENVGLNDPFSKIYITAEVIFDLSAILFLLLLKNMGRFTFDAHIGSRPVKKKDAIDDTPFAVGMLTILRQFHTSVTTEFLAYIGQYIRSYIHEYLEMNQKSTSYPLDAQRMLLFVDIISKFGNIPRSYIEEFIPAYVLAEYLK